MLNRKMRVLHLLASNQFSGAENVVCQIINFMDETCEMAYCSPCGDIEKQLTNKNVHYIPIKKLTKSEVRRVIKEFRPDIIHAHDVRATWFASVSAGKKIPIVAHVHGSDSSKMSKVSLKSLLFYFACINVGHIFWVSNSCFDIYKFKHRLQHKSSILYNIISLTKLRERANEEQSNEYDIAYLGRLESVKNPLRMLEIMKMLVEQVPQLKCVVMGDGSLMQQCKYFVMQYNLTQNIQLCGFVDNPQSILKKSKVLILSSVSEGTPMCALEALGLGVPVVSTPTDGMLDLITNGETGFLYDSNEEAVNRIVEIISNLKEFKDNCLKFAEEYNDLEKYKNSIMDVYKKLLRERDE